MGNIERDVAKIRDEILTACLENNFARARTCLSNLDMLIKNTEIESDLSREFTCRYWESKLDVAAISPNASAELIATLETINGMREFSNARKTEIIARGLSTLGTL